MVLQVGAVRHHMPDELAADAEALQGVERTGRSALGEMRRLLGALRREDEEAELAPQPGLARLEPLLEEVRSAGLRVDLEVDGDPFPLPHGIDVSAYRIVQEALTNTLKHAHASEARVLIGYGSDELRIDVRDDGNGNGNSDGLGHGLIGMRERVKIYGGEMSAASARDGGFTVSTRLPLSGSSRMSITVLVADDQAMVRSGFRLLLAGEPGIEVVAEAGNGLEALQKTKRLEPTVVLMDIRMPDVDGLQATRDIIASGSSARILILTTFDLDEYVYEALRAGASGFVLKDDPPEQLIAAVRTVAAGDALLSPAVTRRVIDQFTRVPLPAPPREFDELTEREREIFVLIADGLSNAEIGARLFISDTTVKTHITHIFQKLGLRDRVQAVVLAHRTGIFDAHSRTPPPG